MKIIKGSALQFVPASHEDPKNPGVLKKILFKADDLVEGGRVQMINWALLPKGKHFELHYHEDMEEIFIILSGKVQMRCGEETEILEKGDAVKIPIGSAHTMENIHDGDVEYLVVGVSLGKGGKTINIPPPKNG